MEDVTVLRQINLLITWSNVQLHKYRDVTEKESDPTLASIKLLNYAVYMYGILCNECLHCSNKE